MEDIVALMIPIVAIVGTFGTVVAVVWLLTRRQRAEIEARTQIYARLLERFGSAQELAEFLKTEEGQAFLRGFALSAEGAGRYPENVLRSIRTGVLLTMLGLGFIAAGWWPTLDEPELGWVGLLLIALGVGFLALAGITYWLSRRWGLTGGRPPGPDAPSRR